MTEPPRKSHDVLKLFNLCGMRRWNDCLAWVVFFLLKQPIFGMKSGRSSVQVPFETNFSILLTLPCSLVNWEVNLSRIRIDFNGRINFYLQNMLIMCDVQIRMLYWLNHNTRWTRTIAKVNRWDSINELYTKHPTQYHSAFNWQFSDRAVSSFRPDLNQTTFKLV